MLRSAVIFLFIFELIFVNAADNHGIEARLRNLESQMQNKIILLQKQVDSTNRELGEVKQELSEAKSREESRRQSKNLEQDPIMFTAQLSPHAENLGDKQPIKFDYVLTNIQNGYDKVTGIFTCPVSGYYFFTCTIMSHTGDYVETALMINGVRKMQIYSGAGSARYNQGTDSVIVQLNAGDRVWIETFNNGNRYVHVYGENWSSFTGFRIN